MADSGDDGPGRDRTTPGEEEGKGDRPPRDRDSGVDPTDTDSRGGEHRPGAAGTHGPNRAANARTDRREYAASTRPGGYRRGNVTDDGDWTGIVSFTVGVFLVFGVGSTLAWFLFVSLAPGGGRTGGGFGSDPLFGSVVVALFLGIFLAPLLAVVTGVVAGRRVRGLPGVEAVTSATIGAGIGFVVMFLAQLFLVVILAPRTGDVGDALGQLLGPVVGMGIGVALTAGLAAYVAANY